MRRNRVLLLLAGATVMLSLGAAVAEIIRLRDGRELEGNVIRRGQTVTVVTADGVHQFPAADVKTAETDTATDAVVQAGTNPTPMENPMIRIKTSKGDITVELFEAKVPNTVANVISLAESGFYEGMTFHRIIPGFMAQGGCPNSKAGAAGMPGTGGPGYRFADEIDATLKHDRPGILSMANSGPNTNGSQFFLCFAPAPWLDGKHAVFGVVTEGLDVLKKLEAVGTRSGQPTEKVTLDIEVISKRDHDYVVRKL